MKPTSEASTQEIADERRTLYRFARPLGTFTLSGQTAKQQAGIDEDKKTIAEYAKSMNVTCGSHIMVTTDYASYKGAGGVVEDNHAPWHDCRNAIDTVDLFVATPTRKRPPCKRRLPISPVAGRPASR